MLQELARHLSENKSTTCLFVNVATLDGREMETNRPNCGVESSRSISAETTGRRSKTNKVKVSPIILRKNEISSSLLLSVSIKLLSAHNNGPLYSTVSYN